MNYISTRGHAPKLDFRGALLAGLASDGGLYVPESVPSFSPQEIAAMASLSYPDLAVKVMLPFIGTSFSEKDVKRMVDAAYAGWRHEAIAPLVQIGRHHHVLELFHGPTLAFKDFALQLLGQFMETALKDKKQKSVVLGATSGDTGSAAIAGLSGREGIDIVILYPEGRTSDVQRKQMTTVGEKNVHAVAIKGTFDDCQAIVKQLFSDATYRSQVNLLAVNSINWARVLAQVVYYFYAALTLGAPARRITFSVPTGNFGDIFAGYTAYRMGLPIERLIIASNRNDILTRCQVSGEYRMAGVEPSLSPSMDIEISSNFERLLFDLYERDAQQLNALMAELRGTGALVLSKQAHADFVSLFAARAVDDATTLSTIKEVFEESGYVLDPHSAVGVHAAETLAKPGEVIVTLATAHPAKFPDAVKQATGTEPALPHHLADLFSREENITVLANDAGAVKELISTL